MFDGVGSWYFSNTLYLFVLTIFSYLIQIIAKTTFLILGEGPTFGAKGSFGSPEKSINLVLILVKQTKTLLEFALQSK